jgi:hypothetical protein
MHKGVEVRIEGKRGCGYRKPGGMYLVDFTGNTRTCGRLPIPLTVCPVCGGGFKRARGFTWVDGDKLLEQVPDCSQTPTFCKDCALQRYLKEGLGTCGLLWVGERFYPTPHDFDREAECMGISRRITTVPKGLKPGETVILLAHRKAIQHADGTFDGGIFRMFKPTHVEIVVKGNESDEVIEDYIRRGLTPVQVYYEGQPTLDAGEAEEE